MSGLLALLPAAVPLSFEGYGLRIAELQSTRITKLRVRLVQHVYAYITGDMYVYHV